MIKPAVRHLLSLNNENQWSNLLASFMETDPHIPRSLFGLADGVEFEVRREVASGTDRPDIVLTDPTGARVRTISVVEVKVLSGLGPRQLDRYLEMVDPHDRDDALFVLVYPARLPIHLPAGSQWKALTWERMLAAFASSAHPWVAETAAAALGHLTSAMPKVGPDTEWCALVDGEDFVVALRARQSWVYGAVTDPARGEKVLHSSSAGVSWVTTVRIPTQRENYSVILEAEETLTVRDWPKYAGQDHRVPIGPSVRLFLLQEGVATSAAFDWDWLLHLWTTTWVPPASRG